MSESRCIFSFMDRKETTPFEIVYLLGCEGTNQLKWYPLDVRRGNFLANMWMPNGVHCGSTVVNVTSHNRVYVLGGYNNGGEGGEEEDPIHLDNRVAYIDFGKLEEGWNWTNSSPMLYKQLRPFTIAFDGKIYVFGGSQELFAQVFDISQNSWILLPAPIAYPFCMSYPILLDSPRSRILVHFSSINSLYAYHVADKSWRCLISDYGEWSKNSVIVDGVIYSLFADDDEGYTFSSTKCSLRAYNVLEKKPLPIICLLGHEVRVTNLAGLFQTGNHKLCLAWYDPNVGNILHGYDSDGYPTRRELEKGLIQYVKFVLCKCKCKCKDCGEIYLARDLDPKLPQNIQYKISYWEFMSS